MATSPDTSPLLVAPRDRLVTMPAGMPELTLGWGVIKHWIKYLKHPNGPRAGLRWEFVPSQIRFLLWWYAVDADGKWLFNHGVRRLAKGSGKSPFAAGMALMEFTGPVRLKDFDPAVMGGCVGKPIDMPLVDIVATSESQTANTMRMVRALCPKSSRLAQDFQIDVGKTQYYKLPEGTLRQRTSSAETAEGAESSTVIADETEKWTPARGGVELMATLVDNLAKSGSRMLETCNAWSPGSDSAAEDSYEAWVMQEAGETQGEQRILYDARIASPHVDMSDGVELMEALRFVYDDCYWADLPAIRERIWNPKAKEADSRRKFLNQLTADDDAWVEPHTFAALAHPEVEVAAGEEIVMFFDGSKSRDATALVGCRISDGHCFLIGAWEPKASHDAEDTVDTHAVDARVRWAVANYSVLAFYADVREWESFVKVSWPDDLAETLLIDAAPKSKEKTPIAWDMRSHAFDFTLAVELTEAEILEGAFTHDGSETLTRHVLNARRRPNRFGVSISKESKDSPKKIDAAVCLVGARMVRRHLLDSKEWRARSRSQRGMLDW